MSSFLSPASSPHSSELATQREESSRGLGGVRSFLNSLQHANNNNTHHSFSNLYSSNNHETPTEDEQAPLQEDLECSGEEHRGGGSQKDFGFFDSLTQKWVNLEDFSEVPPLLEDGPSSLRMWDESLSKIEEVTEVSSSRPLDNGTPRLVLPLNASSTLRHHRPILVSTPSSSVSSSPFEKSNSPPSLRRPGLMLREASHHASESPLPYPRLNRTLPSSRRSSVDESVESFPVNYSKSTFLGKPGHILTNSSSKTPRRSPGSSNSPAPERRRKKSSLLQLPSTTLSPHPSSNRQNRSQSISNFSRLPGSNLNKGKSYSSGNLSLKSNSHDYSHVQSKVKAYIKSIKDLPSTKKPPGEDFSSSSALSAGKKSLSMSNLSRVYSKDLPLSSHQGGSNSIAASNLKSFLSYANLEDLTVTFNKSSAAARSADNLSSKSKFDSSRISRLLDNISDEEAMEEVIDSAAEVDVEDILTLAYNERRDKQEAKKVLSQLQTNYDMLQRKYAEAENTIDKLRFGGSVSGGGLREGVGSSMSGSLPQGLNISSTPLPKESSSSPHTPSSILKGNSSASSHSHLLRSSPVSSQGSSFLKEDPRASEKKGEATKKALEDIQDQLYGLEILSDSLDPKVRDSAMEEVRRSFHSILVNFDNQRGRGKDPPDSEMVELLKMIGKKLYIKNPKGDDEEEDLEELEEDEEEVLDPFEKVSNWKTVSNGSPVSSSAFSSGKSSRIADILSRQQQQQQSHTLPIQHNSNNDFDSGCCPGSERSVRSLRSHPHKTSHLLPYNNLLLKKKGGSSSLLESSSTTTTTTTNTSLHEEEEDLEEEVEEVHPPPPPSTAKRQIKRVDTDLSSSCEEEEEEEEDNLATPQPKALVQQINEDINDLRSLFEDHREEMMWLVSQEQKAKDHPSGSSSSSQQRRLNDMVLLPPPTSGSNGGSSSRRSLSSLHFAAVSSSPPVSPGESRRGLKSPLHSRYLSQSQSLRRLGHIGQVRRRFETSEGEDFSNDDREIRRREFERRRKSKLTKRRSRESLLLGLNGGGSGGGGDLEEGGLSSEVELLSGDGRIFIPKLKIEDLWTDRTGDEGGGGLSSSSAASSSVSRRRGGLPKKKPNKEIKDLLRSLEHANKMATKLKERSEEMLTVLKSEMSHPAPPYSLGEEVEEVAL
eukprot:TRINITY_DN2397_c0_g1_i1.p1 TRINITY_DN2397_c0_g1~~TRINITY_DN2397_c0_g1_i1.p1  ORF type:complete len:1159 (-),score=499.33 TRINITY_DN2397_c0_g1_i1:548-4024(-)